MTSPSPDGPVQTAFGAGGSEPYARALRDGTAELELADVLRPARRRSVAVRRFTQAADAVDHRVLQRARGPVLDVGCGPGRMVAAALGLGLPALGVDVSRAAVGLGRAAGLPVVLRSVFDPLPVVEGFATLLLLDGNVGIGGSPLVLLARCHQLVRPGGNVLAEVDDDPEADRAFSGVLRTPDGRSSAPFPWAEAGRAALVRHARRAGLAVAGSWSDEGRRFVELERRG